MTQEVTTTGCLKSPAATAGALLESVKAIGNLVQISTMSLASLDALHGDLSSHDMVTQPSTEVRCGQTLGVLFTLCLNSAAALGSSGHHLRCRDRDLWGLL